MMVPETLPGAILEECNNFASNFKPQNELRLPHELTHTGNWVEEENKLEEVSKEILKTLKSIWCNPAFLPQFSRSLNEGTYVNNVIIPLIQAALYYNPFGESSYISLRKFFIYIDIAKISL